MSSGATSFIGEFTCPVVINCIKISHMTPKARECCRHESQNIGYIRRRPTISLVLQAITDFPVASSLLFSVAPICLSSQDLSLQNLVFLCHFNVMVLRI